MPELTQLYVDGITYDIQDTKARESIRELQTAQQEVKNLISSIETEINEILEEVM